MVLARHIDHEGALAGDLDIPEDVGHCCDRGAEPPCKHPYRRECLVALPWCLNDQAHDWQNPC